MNTNDHHLANAMFDFSGRHPRLRPVVARVLNALYGNKVSVKGKGNRLDCRSAFLRNVVLRIKGDNNTVRLGVGTRISNMSITVFGSGHVLDIGVDCLIKAGSIGLEDSDGRLCIGANTTIEQADIAVTESGRIEIGQDCMLAFGIDVRNGDSHTIVDASSHNRINAAEDIHIADHVWIGAHVQVLKGSSVGAGSVIGIRSVVTGSVPPGVVAAGVPARVVREGIAWNRRR